MNEQDSQSDVLVTIRGEIAAERASAEIETDPEARQGHRPQCRPGHDVPVIPFRDLGA